MKSTTDIKDDITEDFVRAHFMNKDFCKFIFDYAGTASNTKREFIEKIFDKKDGRFVNVFTILTPSDIAWAVTVYVSNREVWVHSVDLNINNRRRSRAPAAATSINDPPKLWVKKRGGYGACGFSDEGRTFYTYLKDAFRKIAHNEWEAVWDEFWMPYPKNSLLSPRKRKAMEMESSWEPDDNDDEEDVVNEDIDCDMELPPLDTVVGI